MSTITITLTDTPNGFSVRSHYSRPIGRDSVLTPAEAEAMKLTRQALATSQSLLAAAPQREGTPS